jgi:hypothetical protein
MTATRRTSRLQAMRDDVLNEARTNIGVSSEYSMTVRYDLTNSE